MSTRTLISTIAKRKQRKVPVEREYWNPKLLKASRNPKMNGYAWAVFSALRGPDEGEYRKHEEEGDPTIVTDFFLKNEYTTRIRGWAMTEWARVFGSHALVFGPFTKQNIFIALRELDKYYHKDGGDYLGLPGHFISHVRSALEGIIAIERWKEPELKEKKA